MKIYDTEEEQVLALKSWWQQYGISVISGIVIGILGVSGWSYWQDQQNDQALQATALFSDLLANVEAKQHAEVETISASIIEQYATSPYTAFAALFLAKSKVEAGDLDAAKRTLEKLMHEADSAELTNIARLRLIRVLQAQGENEQGLQLIAAADKSTVSGFAASYNELAGDLYVALNRLAEARTAYEAAVRDGSKSPLLQIKLDDISVAAEAKADSESNLSQ